MPIILRNKKGQIVKSSGRTPGFVVSEETKEKMSKANKGVVITWGDKISKAKKSINVFEGKEHPKGMLGKKQSEKQKQIMRARLNEKHPLWVGNEVSYRALHSWVIRKKGQPDICEHCKKTRLTGRKIHWANKSGKYLRQLTDWLRLCVKCHRAYDNARRLKLAN